MVHLGPLLNSTLEANLCICSIFLLLGSLNEVAIKNAEIKALGSMYFIHKSLKNIRQYDFSVKDFKAVPGLDKFVGSLDGVTTMEKEKFPKNFWPDFKWSRKGFMRTRWIIHDRGLDLVNVHLFHDASNLIACKTSPSVYSANRKNALRHVINRISDNCHNTTPFFLFGDFNFRLDTLSLVQHLSTSAEVQTVKKDRSNEVQKIICEEKADRQVLLLIEDKLFAYLHQAVFRDDNGRALLKYDKEVTAFHDVVREEEITFPPSYPYSEEYTKPTQYMNTRCPAWCDRILMSHAAQQFIHSGADGEKSVVYDTVGPNVCMGDHKVETFSRNMNAAVAHRVGINVSFCLLNSLFSYSSH
ncbi:inositol polyphosphate-5-phosphatase A isoform X3 [Phycodurus eques]|uniref:inositol polyphosphate-5-phosphatase A isoform X3 n=1 Tax=Phycodurus eques TaxID=693459 RepID=UPI002ACDEE08|nr:inositol polyphosphate-5-phosphatase A isoform X3 [Phycodurus eques]